MTKRKNNPDHNPTKDKAPVEEPGKERSGMVLADDSDFDPDLDELEDYEMADMQSIREIIMLDPNDIEFRQRHSEVNELDNAA
ncbi:MAG: hypothetical protein AB7K68_10030 [Bacteriovoracia bacterium]